MTRCLAIFVFLFGFATNAHAQSLEQKIDDFYMAHRTTPGMGMAVGIVKDGKLSFFKGYGFRDHEKQLPVTADTLFAIGSNSKSFTSLAISMYADEGKASLELPLKDQFPGFAMSNPYVTGLITPVDMMSHRTGLPRHDLLWYITPFTRTELFERIPFLQMNPHPGMGFREAFQYNNLMFMTIGYWTERIAGKSWEQVMQDRIFTPLSMSSTNTSLSQMQSGADYALPYYHEYKMPFHPVQAIGPAGSVNSNVNDLVKWLQFHLNGGVAPNGEALISKAAHARIFQMESDASPLLQGAKVGYGLGWFLSDIGGHRVIWHGGNIDGFSSFISFAPDSQTAVIVLTNESAGSVFEFPITSPATAGHEATDLLPLVIYNNLLNVAPAPAPLKLDLFASAGFSLTKLLSLMPFARVAATDPRAPTNPIYLGRFAHPAYGEISVTDNAGQMILNYYDNHWPMQVATQADHFNIPITLDGTSGGLDLIFQRVSDGIVSLTLPFEPDVDPILFNKSY